MKEKNFGNMTLKYIIITLVLTTVKSKVRAQFCTDQDAHLCFHIKREFEKCIKSIYFLLTNDIKTFRCSIFHRHLYLSNYRTMFHWSSVIDAIFYLAYAFQNKLLLLLMVDIRAFGTMWIFFWKSQHCMDTFRNSFSLFIHLTKHNTLPSKTRK